MSVKSHDKVRKEGKETIGKDDCHEDLGIAWDDVTRVELEPR